MSQELDDTRSVPDSLPDESASAPAKQSYRSFKKKYAKLKVKFELGMRESEALIREELRIEDLSKRIQEQNDQLLEVLLEFNESLHVQGSLRYNLSAPGDTSFLPTPERSPAHLTSATARAILQDAKAQMGAGSMSVGAYRRLEDDVKRSNALPPQLSYTTLTQVPHTAPPSEAQDLPTNVSLEEKLGFLTPEHETEYYLGMDAKLGDEGAAVQLSRIPEKPSLAERERESTLRNPVSVYNWLRRNQPHIFLQDNENASEKSGSRPSNLRVSKRMSTQPRKEEDTYDEDGVPMDTGPVPSSSKSKRKRDDDSGYRPKGGSSRPSKKKKEDNNSSTKRPAKRPSGVGA
ncbi:uncharacterized protein ACLA_033820 [Aspergillus clavatus NRRL 1]|uniref:IEC3 subunit of the Ino80 complex, chromatin re-modelling-domain-containing protein n=1 Tax=Aspergillus clavatus (strain ATCC 1007 / CBS 513.65 / DSM 816 / NCTC 3887 / NRRL 1 / QM 1276 / 107) TaxID=344612 RepID=A1CJ55_ASPCL|nr:uncharacterized protein ACLA_033820 [Aspergillus clavatus NRRL 1]EAW09179.1 conserved hypothetical protein [Aspergillus clavatus NRRL 1]